MLPIPPPPSPPQHRTNRRDDGHADFASLKAGGQVRNKRGKIIGIDDIGGVQKISARQRDALYQGYCDLFFATSGDEDSLRRYVVRQANGLGISPSRAWRIIGQGNGEWDSPNSMWWRGCSVR